MEVMTYTNVEEEKPCITETQNDDTKRESVFYKPSLTNLVPSSLLALLDDKNKSILLLKRQIHNQKLQLGFYLNKVLNNPQVMQLADSCAPYEAEENLHVNLAMVRFCKQTGLKSTLMNLHQRMLCMEKNILDVAQQQEEMVHGIVTKIAEFAKQETNESNPKIFLTKLNDNDEKVDNLAKILGSTIKLRKELDVFKTCCNRLVIIEDERNSLVDQVYSMPVSKRLSYGVLLAAQYEKLRLEKEIIEMKRENKYLQERLAQCPQAQVVNRVDAFTITALPAPGGDKTSVHKLLEIVNTDAVSILNISKDRKDKYVEEIAKLQETNNELQVQVELMREIDVEREELELRLRQTRTELEKVQDDKNQDFIKIRCDLQSVENEREYLQNKLIYYYDMEDQLQYMRSNVNELESAKKERDYYKAQAEDLEGIRQAYAQLMETCAIRGNDGDGDSTNDLTELMDKIKALETEREGMLTETSNLGNIIADQQSQIKELLIIIQEIARHSEESQVPKSNSFTQTVAYSDFLGGYAYLGRNAGHKCAFSQTNHEIGLKQLLKEIKLPANQRTRIVFNNGTGDLEEKHRKEEAAKPTELLEEQETSKVIASPLVSTTSVEVQTLNDKGETESMKAQLESSSKVEGVIKVSDSLSFRVTCTPPVVPSNPKLVATKTTSKLAAIASEKEIRTANLASTSSKNVIQDEFELMKDSSNEALIVTLPSIHHQVGNFVTTVQCMRKSLSSLSRSRMEEYGKSCPLPTTKESLSTVFESKIPMKNFSVGDRNASVLISHKSARSEVSFVESESTDVEHTIGEDGDLGVGVSITNRLKKLTSEMHCTLSKPGGKDSLVNAVIDMYSTLFTKSN